MSRAGSGEVVDTGREATLLYAADMFCGLERLLRASGFKMVDVGGAAARACARAACQTAASEQQTGFDAVEMLIY
jgi:hypothetical protein